MERWERKEEIRSLIEELRYVRNRGSRKSEQAEQRGDHVHSNGPFPKRKAEGSASKGPAQLLAQRMNKTYSPRRVFVKYQKTGKPSIRKASRGRKIWATCRVLSRNTGSQRQERRASGFLRKSDFPSGTLSSAALLARVRAE